MKNRTYLLAWTMILLVLTATMKVAGAPSNSFGPYAYEPHAFTTLAGLAQTNTADGIPISGSADGTGSAARFAGPSGVAVDGAGNVYVADTGNHTIRKVTAAGVVTTLAGLAQLDNNGNSLGGSADGTEAAARFNQPVGVAVDSTGNVYVADTGNHTIRKVTAVGVVTTLAGLAQCCDVFGESFGGSADGTGSAARFNGPSGVAVDSAGNIYIADVTTIRKVTSAGVVTTLAGLAGSFGSADGMGSAAQFSFASGVAVDGAGNVYVADQNNSTIRKVTPAGVVTTLAGLAGRAASADGTGDAARFIHPAGVAVDSAGEVYVADQYFEFGYSMIRKTTPTGVVTTLAGLAAGRGSTDGTGSDARFNVAWGVAVDTAGNVYVADTFNHTIRKGYPAPRILNSGPSSGFNGGQFGFNLTGPSGRSVVVEASTDLVSWLPLWTNVFTFPTALNVSDPQSGISSRRFYRAVMP